jgi:osmotically-inducible protein OsmY
VEKLKIISRRVAPAALILIICACLPGISCRTNESPEGQVNDLEITAQVKAKLASDIGPSSVTNVSVNSTNSVVTLSGQVDSVDVKSRAVAIAKATPKVVRVVDSLQVTPKPQ